MALRRPWIECHRGIEPMRYAHFPAAALPPIIVGNIWLARGRSDMRCDRIEELLVTLACLAVSGVALLAAMWIALDMPPRAAVVPLAATASVDAGAVR